ncbi:MAG: MaoC family dehydratase [Pseudomonadota bacterium]
MSEKVKTNELQPMTEIQIKQTREFVNSLKRGLESFWDMVEEGDERTWEVRITPESVIMYADGVEDYNPWYEAWVMNSGPKKGESPFGPAIVPPLMLSHWAIGVVFDCTRPFPIGAIHTFHDSRILEPLPIGTLVRFRSKVVSKFVKRDRRYVRHEIAVEDAETGKVFFKETRDTLSQYKKV